MITEPELTDLEFEVMVKSFVDFALGEVGAKEPQDADLRVYVKEAFGMMNDHLGLPFDLRSRLLEELDRVG